MRVKRLNLRTLLEGGYRNLAWPPPDVAGPWALVREYRLRYGADAGTLFASRPELTGSDGPESDVGRFTPSPVAAEIAGMSSALLFGEPPTLAAREARDQPALDALARSNRLDELLTVAGELVAVEGAGGLRVALDDAVPGGVVLTYASGDRVLWRSKHGRFTTGGVVVLEHEDRDGTRWRLLEDHDVGTVTRRLFKGGVVRLGDARPLAEGPEQWRGLKPETATGLLDRATLVRWENRPGGASDLAGLLPLLDALDDALTLLRSKAAASAPILAAHESLLDENGDFQAWAGFVFKDPDQFSGEFYAPKDRFQVAQAQFDAAPMIAYTQHLRAQIVSGAGYSPESWTGEGTGGRADSGRALALRQTRTRHTAGLKRRMAERAVSEALGVATALYLGRPMAEALMPSVGLVDTVAAASEDVAQTQDRGGN
jgi:hypothetical protein